MSRENVEIVRKLFEVYNERSFVENQDLIDPAMVWDMSRVELPDATAYIGPSGFLQFIQAWEEGITLERMEAEEVVDAGERVVVMVSHHGQDKASGIEVGQHFAMVWTVRGGRATRMELYRTREEALEAVGLSEQDARADS